MPASMRTAGLTVGRGRRVAAFLEPLLRTPTLVVAGTLLATFALYFPTLNDWFQTDDFLLLSGAQDLPFTTYAREAFDFRDFEPLHLYTYRPLHFATMDVMHAAFGLQATPYHAVSVALHVLNVLLVWRIARQLSGSDAVAHGTAAIFGLHPAYTQTVAWVAANNSVIATTGQLVAFLAFLQFVRNSSRTWYLASVVVYGAAILVHQEVFLLPAVFGAYLVFVQYGNLRDALRPAVVTLLPYSLVLGIFLAIQRWNARESVLNDHFVLNLGTLGKHTGVVAMSVYPSQLSGFHATHALAASLFAVAVLGGLLLARRNGKVIVLCIIWYHASLVLSELYFVNTPAIPYLGRKLYPAGPALALAIALVAESYWEALKPRLASVAPYLLVLVGVALALAFVRAGELRDRLEPAAERSQLFVDDLRAAYPELFEGDTLYVARAPFSCGLLICYTRDVVSLYYDEVDVSVISVAQAQDPAFLAALGPDDHVFCWRCPAPGASGNAAPPTQARPQTSRR